MTLVGVGSYYPALDAPARCSDVGYRSETYLEYCHDVYVTGRQARAVSDGFRRLLLGDAKVRLGEEAKRHDFFFLVLFLSFPLHTFFYYINVVGNMTRAKTCPNGGHLGWKGE